MPSRKRPPPPPPGGSSSVRSTSVAGVPLAEERDEVGAALAAAVGVAHGVQHERRVVAPARGVPRERREPVVREDRVRGAVLRGVVEQVHGRADLLAEDADELGVLDQRANLQIARGGAVGGDEVVVRRRLRVEPERGGRDHQHLARGLRADEEIGHRRRGRSGEARRARGPKRARARRLLRLDRSRAGLTLNVQFHPRLGAHFWRSVFICPAPGPRDICQSLVSSGISPPARVGKKGSAFSTVR